MDPNFQTSFIPKKGLGETKKPKKKRGSVGIFSVIAVTTFVLSMALSGGVYLYLKMTEGSISRKSEQLEKARASFELESINELSKLDKKLNVGNELINQHVAPSAVFEALEESTLKSIRFTEMAFNHGVDEYSIILRGEAKNFSSIAKQSDIFGENKTIKQPVFSNLNLDENGNVDFVFSALMNPSSVLYKNNLGTTN